MTLFYIGFAFFVGGFMGLFVAALAIAADEDH